MRRVLTLLAAVTGLLAIPHTAQATTWKHYLHNHPIRLAAPRPPLPDVVSPLWLKAMRDYGQDYRIAWLKRQVTFHELRQREIQRVIALAQAAASKATHSITHYTSAPPGRSGVDWDAIARCESGGNWTSSGGSFEGGLQFLNSTWLSAGGGGYAPHAYQATRTEQITIAQWVWDHWGPNQWPYCHVFG